MAKLRCIIVDDIEIDRLTVLAYVKKFPFFEVVGVFASGIEALSALETEKIDVLFLDIDMPGLSGIALRKKALDVPVCVFITSHSEYALDSYELDALDYLVKPLHFERFSHTVKRVEDFMEMRSKASLFESSIGGDTVFIKEGHSETKVKLPEILYLEALKNYTLVVTGEKKHRVLLNIGTLLKDPNFQAFVRVHRGFAVQKHFITKITAQEVFLPGNVAIPVGRNFKENLRNLQ
ncbi:MAG TPA: LytTR family DNA-binding domain-containing protein [Flavobacterium sp.]|nr:LytTR family DNA-binding domain-containing protein [Flavobacterium sp.]